MLSKTNRLRKTADIEQIFKTGRGFREGFLFLKLAQNNLNATRFAFIVSKKISGKASVRNRIKRLLRAAVRRRMARAKATLPAGRQGFDAALIVQKGAESKNFKEVELNIEKLFKKAKLI